MKKFLSGLLIGAFVFSVGAANIQPVSAASLGDIKSTKDKFDKSKKKVDKAKDKIDKAQEKFGKNKSDDKTPPEPPKDENGNPLPPPDKKDNDNFSGMKDEFDNAKDSVAKAKKILRK